MVRWMLGAWVVASLVAAPLVGFLVSDRLHERRRAPARHEDHDDVIEAQVLELTR